MCLLTLLCHGRLEYQDHSVDPLWDGLGYAIGYWIQVLFKAHIPGSEREERERERERERGEGDLK